MLDLLRAYTPSPVTGLHYLSLPHETLLLYPLADSIIILNAGTLALVRTLAFWEVFPSTRHHAHGVRCLAVDPAMRLIVASQGTHLAAWSLSTTSTDPRTWRVHSSLTLPQAHEITSLECKSGLLAIGSTGQRLSVFTLILENDLPTWSPKWTNTKVPPPTRIRFSPSLMYFATTTSHDTSVRIYLTTSGRQTQSIAHPRPLVDVKWRDAPQASNRDDLILYTITTDTTLRIFLPVLDAPHRLQLHLSLPPPTALSPSPCPSSAIFCLDRSVVNSALTNALLGLGLGDEKGKGKGKEKEKAESGQVKRVRDIKAEGWDLFLRVLADGSLVVNGVANIDRRPPTLLRQFTVLRTPPSFFPSPSPPKHLYLLPNPPPTFSSNSKPSLQPTPIATLITTSPLRTSALSPLPFFDALSSGLRCLSTLPETTTDSLSPIKRFVRTPDGRGVGVVREGGAGECWAVKFGRDRKERLVRVEGGGWEGKEGGEEVVVLDRGNAFVTYSEEEGVLTLHTTPPATLPVPKLTSLFTLPPSPPSSSTPQSIIGITPTSTILHIHAHLSPSPTLTSHSHTSLPLPTPPSLILPVDPMAWAGPAARDGEHDVLLSVSAEGGLAFWAFGGNGGNGGNGSGGNGEEGGWRCTGRVRTGRRGIRMARCSSAKKSVLVVPTPDGGEELTIWDSKESEFASGLEHLRILDPTNFEPVKDLDWSWTPDSQSVLAVGFSHFVEIMCEQRMTYFDEGPRWGRCWKIDIGEMITHPIGDSIWLTSGSLLVGAGQQMLLFGQPERGEGQEESESLFEHVARINGPLPDYHPQMLLQCLLWGKIELVKDVIVNLSKYLEDGPRGNFHDYQSVPCERYLEHRQTTAAGVQQKPQYSFLFDGPVLDERSEDEEGFSRPLVTKLIQQLEGEPILHLTRNENAQLLVLIQTTLEIDEQRRALDANGLRYLITMRSFHISNYRASTPNSPTASNFNGVTPKQTGWRERLRYRDMVWAFHSESEELLLSSSVAASGGKMTWPEARSLGVFIWLKSVDTMKSHMEVIARNQYMAGEVRDPTLCSLFYFALGKVKLVHGLWRQAAWHTEQAVMLKFLANDFKQARWRTAAMKNAYALLSKRRYEYAAAFFLLGGSLKDAVQVCIRNLSDFQLAVALARVIEQGDNGPILHDILTKSVIPTAFKEGNRWLASWAFWLLKRRDLAVRILITPLPDIATEFGGSITEIGEPHYDDPSLALLFSQLKSKTLQTAKGTSEISGRTEFNFVLQIARVFCRMGCHALALDLVRSWSFTRPSTAVHKTSPTVHHERLPPSPGARASLFALEPAMRRTSSIMIDMDVSSGAPTRSASPEPGIVAKPPPKENIPKDDGGDLLARKAGLGSLMKSAKQDVKVPEFDMNAFF